MEKTSQAKNKSYKIWPTIIGLVLIIVSIVSIILFFLHGETKITGNWSGKQTTESLTCKASNKSYNIYESKDVLNSTTQINATFNDSKIDSISLLRKATYPDSKTAKVQSDAVNFAVNDNFGKNGLKPYSLSATFSTDGEVAQFSLYAKSEEISQKTIKYFMLDNLPNDIDGYEKAFQVQGFNCETSK